MGLWTGGTFTEKADKVEIRRKLLNSTIKKQFIFVKIPREKYRYAYISR